MRARLDSFRLPGPSDEAIYGTPLQISYGFFTEGGYVGLAKEFRQAFLQTQPAMQTLTVRAQTRPAVGHLADAVYIYFWGKTPAEDLQVAREMKAAGIERAIAIFYGKHETDRATCDGIKELGWVVGQYRMPTGNLFQVATKHHWPVQVLTGRISPEKLLADSHRSGWERICGKEILKSWPPKAQEMIDQYGFQLFYFDTFVNQLAPCLDPDHPSTIEENQAARVEILKATQDMGMVLGSGEGCSPTWALPRLDFFEGLMNLRTYSDNELKIPAGDYAKDLGEEYAQTGPMQLDETRRVPLYQLGFHDYVAGTWVWRDTTYQSSAWAWKKNLFNILYCTLPMWHADPALWKKFGPQMAADFQQVHGVRQRIGFSEMTNHGWLTPDRRVQFTDWSSGDRVIVNFSEQPFARAGAEPIAARSFALEKAPQA